VSTCVPTHALLSAIVRRIAGEGHVPSASDLRALLDLRLPEAEIAAAIEASGARVAAAALARLREVTGGAFCYDDIVIDTARYEFARQGWVKLEGFVSPPLLDHIGEGLAASGFAPRSHGAFGSELCLNAGPLTDLLMHLTNARPIFELVDGITGCGSIGCFEGRIYRFVPGAGHHDDWHSDMVMGRLVALSVNVGRVPYAGGELHLRRADTREVIARVPNVGPGDALLFRLSHDLEHCVSDVTGTEPKTAYAGWFRVRPRFEDVIAGRANF
jgi:hypothetical protein